MNTDKLASNPSVITPICAHLWMHACRLRSISALPHAANVGLAFGRSVNANLRLAFAHANQKLALTLKPEA